MNINAALVRQYFPKRTAKAAKAKRPRMETLLVIDPHSTWVARIDPQEFIEFAREARYAERNITTEIQWVAIWGVGAFALLALPFMALFGMTTGTYAAFCVASLAAFWPGWSNAKKKSHKAEWCIWRIPQIDTATGEITGYAIQAVTPEAIIRDSSRTMPFRADLMDGIRDQKALGDRFARSRKGYKRMQQFSLVMLISVVLAAAWFIYSTPEIKAPDADTFTNSIQQGTR